VLEFVVEQGVPRLPAKFGRAKPPGHGRQKYPFKSMLPGDSFAAEVPHDLSIHRLLARLCCAAKNYATRRPEPQPFFECRMLYEENCVRVWRVR
jgi:hypothetical protein